MRSMEAINKAGRTLKDINVDHAIHSEQNFWLWLILSEC